MLENADSKLPWINLKQQATETIAVVQLSVMGTLIVCSTTVQLAVQANHTKPRAIVRYEE